MFQVVRAEILALMDREGVPAMELSEETSLIDDVGLSSLSILDLVTSIEAALDCRFENIEAWATNELEKGRTLRVGAIVDATWATVLAGTSQ